MREELINMKEGEKVFINWSEGGGGLVTKKGDIYTLHEVPIYGGIPQVDGEYTKSELDKLIEKAMSWT
jgi:hypothetical protein